VEEGKERKKKGKERKKELIHYTLKFNIIHSCTVKIWNRLLTFIQWNIIYRAPQSRGCNKLTEHIPALCTALLLCLKFAEDSVIWENKMMRVTAEDTTTTLPYKVSTISSLEYYCAAFI
jgi:hypothetical protein